MVAGCVYDVHMATDMKLSTCARCAGTIKWSAVLGAYQHVGTHARSDTHQPEPDDSHVSGPDEDEVACEFCGGPHNGMTTLCSDDLEAERALDEDADMYADNAKD
jgi:hypothetical protein